MKNPFLLASAPPTALVESIDKAFEMGWGGTVLKTITPDNLEMTEASPRYAIMKEKGKIIGFQNIELLSHKTVQYWVDGIRYLNKKYHLHPKIDKEVCVKCGKCVKICSESQHQALSVNDNK